jgi:acetolactate synthase-1/2/3 large subunit
MGRGIVDDRNPMGMTLPAGHRLWKDCDVALAIGTRFQLPASAWGMDANLNVVRIDVDREEVDRLPSPAQALIGDARIILRALIDELASARRAPGRARWENHSQATKAAVAAEMQVLDPQLAYLRAIRDVLPDDGVLVDELTQVGYVARVGYEVRRPRTYLSSGYQGTLGWGFATALGAKERLGSTPVVSITGDGGFMFTAQEMATAICHNIPLVTILFNDGAFGNVRRMQEELYGNRVICSHLANPDFRQFIESFGAAFFRATNPAELRVTLAKAIECGRPALIEVPVGPMPSPWKFLELPKVRGA